MPLFTGVRREHSRAGDAAADYYLKMAGDTTAAPVGAIEELMERAVEKGSVTPEGIAEVLDTDKLPIDLLLRFSF